MEQVTKSASVWSMPEDAPTAEAFSDSWVNCYSLSPYTLHQAREWLKPIELEDLVNLSVCEMGCGNGGLLQYTASHTSKGATGVDLGRSIDKARENFRKMGLDNVTFVKEDILSFSRDNANRYDFVYCIGVLHHMKRPYDGFQAVVRATRPGGRFHCWVYGHEGNLLIRTCVEPLRRIASRLPWWLNKYCVAFPLALPFYMISKTLRRFRLEFLSRYFPLYAYFKWIGEYSFGFHHHVTFDQLVSPRTAYLKKQTVEEWISSPELEEVYLLPRNGNSWIFGGMKRK